MGYQMNDGRWADTDEVTLFADPEGIDGSGQTEAVEVGDRGTLRLTLDATSMKATGTNEKQSIAVTDATDGTLTLAFGADVTAALDHDADAATVQAALEALPSIGAGNVEATGGPWGTAPIVVEYVGELGSTNVGELVADDALLVGAGAAAAVATTVPGVAGAPTLTVKVQTSEDGVNDWRDIASFTQLTAIGTERKCFTGADRFVRLDATAGGTNPQIVFTVTGEAV